MDEETSAAANVDPDTVLTGEEIDKAVDISRAEAAANAEAGAQADSAEASEGGPPGG